MVLRRDIESTRDKRQHGTNTMRQYMCKYMGNGGRSKAELQHALKISPALVPDLAGFTE
jgi:hypothetical protein